MDQRLELQRKLEEILGSKNVYFQPPPNVTLKYPCIIYNLEAFDPWMADGETYFLNLRYRLTYIDRRPDSDIPEKLERMRYTSLVSIMTVEGLYHYTFNTSVRRKNG